MDAGWDEGLIVVGSGQGHLRQVKDEVADLAEELVLVDVPVAVWTSGGAGLVESAVGSTKTYPPGMYGSESKRAIPLNDLHPLMVGGSCGSPMNWE